MSYNTRRSGGNQSYNNGMGGRGRAGMNQSFISSGQKPGGLNQVRPQQQQQQMRQQGPQPQRQGPPPQQQQQPQQAQTPQPFAALRQPLTPLPPAPLKSALKKEVKNEPQTPKANQPQQQQQQQPVMQTPPKPAVQTPSKPVIQQTPPTVVQQPPTPQTGALPPAVPPTLPVKPEGMDTENGNGEGRKKILVMKGKISKKEKRGRRNRRLRKILVPKNALMVLNELVGGHKFTFLEKDPNQPNNFFVENDTYIASVTIDGSDHIGYGKSKTAAKTSAAENALRHIILSKISSPLGAAMSTQSVDSEPSEAPMEVDGEKQEEEDVSWLHVASFAMHKLFSSWYADGDEKLDQAKILARTGPAEMVAKLQDIKPFPGPPKTRKPAKQLPQNPQLLNPVMLLNQMRDDVAYEEFSKTGAAPHITFVIKTTVEGQDFFGKGGNKKIARKNCAYAACRKLYGIEYPAEEYDPLTAQEGTAMF